MDTATPPSRRSRLGGLWPFSRSGAPPLYEPQEPPVGAPFATASAPEKIGAGLLLTCDGDVLLLLRNSIHNNLTWGLPGGNVEEADGGDLRRTAHREATEELGPLPPHVAGGEYLTRRGKRGQKQYTVFVCQLQGAARASFRPVLNAEHCEARWFSPQAVRAALAGGTQPPAPMHPVVEALLRQHPAVLRDS